VANVESKTPAMVLPFRLSPTSTPRIFTIRFHDVPRATLALDIALSPKQLEKWRSFVWRALNQQYQREDLPE